MTSLLAQHISEAITNEHIGPGYWRLRTDDWDLPGVLAAHLLAKGWREPLPEVDLSHPTPEQIKRVLTAIDLASELEALDRETLESRAFDAIWELQRKAEA